MLDASDPFAQLQGRIIALQLVVQDILGRQAAESGDFNGFLSRIHDGVHDDLTRVQLDGHDRQRDQTILMFADAALDQIFGPIRKGPASH